MKKSLIGKPSLKAYFVLWFLMAAAYVVWMAFFLRYDTYPPADSGIKSLSQYILWACFSTALLLLFPVYIKLFLNGSAPGRALKYFCLTNLIVGCAYVTWFGFLKDPFEYTASMIGLDYPIYFKFWGLLATLSVFTNVLYMYGFNGYRGRAGVVCASLGSAALFVTINVPSAGEDLILNSLRCMSHWTGALLFAILGAASILVFLVNRAKRRNARYIAALVVFSIILATMLTLLVVVGKNGVIESLPMWSGYLLLFLINFTNIFGGNPKAVPREEAVPAEKQAEREAPVPSR